MHGRTSRIQTAWVLDNHVYSNRSPLCCTTDNFVSDGAPCAPSIHRQWHSSLHIVGWCIWILAPGEPFCCVDRIYQRLLAKYCTIHIWHTRRHLAIIAILWEICHEIYLSGLLLDAYFLVFCCVLLKLLLTDRLLFRRTGASTTVLGRIFCE